MRFSSLLQLAAASIALIAPIAAHPGGHHHISARELTRRQAEANKRHLVARNCEPMIRRFHAERKAKRMVMMERQLPGDRQGQQGQHPDQQGHKCQKGQQNQQGQQLGQSGPHNSWHANPPSDASAETPYHTTIDNYTCVTAPEVTEAPFYINNEMVRTDLREDLCGVTLILDIGVIDTETCTPLPNAFVELWSANATGVYSGYPERFGTSAEVVATMTATGSTWPGAVPSGSGVIPITVLVRNETFLRGGWHTNKEGIVEIKTIYPGFYTQRAPHIHTMVHMNWEKAENGTLISHAGTVAHVGQVSFEESWNDLVYSTWPYTENTNIRSYNKDDWILAAENADGNNAFVDLKLLRDDVRDGVVGWVTIGVNPSASYGIINPNYLNSTGA